MLTIIIAIILLVVLPLVAYFLQTGSEKKSLVSVTARVYLTLIALPVLVQVAVTMITVAVIVEVLSIVLAVVATAITLWVGFVCWVVQSVVDGVQSVIAWLFGPRSAAA